MASSVGRWHALSKVTVGDLAATVNPHLEAFGYAPVQGRRPGTAESARRHYELGLMMGWMAEPRGW